MQCNSGSDTNITPRPSLESDEVAENSNDTRNQASAMEYNAKDNRTAGFSSGQNCVYIPPGDHEEENYRLATYGRFPAEAPVTMADLAAVGLYYTGTNDRVKCFSCGHVSEKWTIGDDEYDPHWHEEDCKMMAGTDDKNKPIPNSGCRQMLRLMLGKSLFTPPNITGNATMNNVQTSMMGEERNINLTASTLSGSVSDVIRNIQQPRGRDSLPEISNTRD